MESNDTSGPVLMELISEKKRKAKVYDSRVYSGGGSGDLGGYYYEPEEEEKPSCFFRCIFTCIVCR